MSGAAATTLKFLLVGEDHLSKVLHGAGNETEQTGQKLHKMSTGSKVALAAVGVAAVGFAKSSIDKFKEVSQQTLDLQRSFGGTIEDASRLRFAAGETDTGFEAFAKSTAKLSKGLYTATLSTKSTADMTKILGFNFKDAQGHLLPMSQLLPLVADRFSHMKSGTEKTAYAMTLFGKSGLKMLPFLNKGKEGLQDLEKESDKFGLTLSGKNIAAMEKSKQQSREWHAALEGLQVQIGAQLLPIMSQLIGFIQSYVIPIFQKITAFVTQHQSLFKFLGITIGALVVAWKIWTAALAVWNAVLDANPIALVVIALVALGAGLMYAYKKSETFRNILQGVWSFLKTWGPAILALFLPVIGVPLLIWQHWSQIKGFITRVWDTVWPYLKTWGPVALAVLVPFLGIPLLIFQHFSQIKGFIGGVFDWVKNKIGSVIKWISGAISAAISAIQGAIDKVNEFLGLTGSNNIGGSVLDNILNTQGGSAGPHKNHRAHGGPVIAGTPYIVGERRPEVFVPNQNGWILPKVPAGPSNGSGAAAPSGGQPMTEATGRQILRALQQSGDVYLDSAKVGSVMGRQADRYARGG